MIKSPVLYKLPGTDTDGRYTHRLEWGTTSKTRLCAMWPTIKIGLCEYPMHIYDHFYFYKIT